MDRKQQTKDALRRVGVQPSKHRGQNFLSDAAALDQLVDFAGILSGEAVVEIGPGLGALTEAMLNRGAKVLAVEIEEKFANDLEVRFPQLLVVREDIRNMDGATLAGLLGTERFVLASNVPYSISTDVTLWVLKNRKYLTRASLLLQKEFARRLAADPGGREYGSLTVARTLYAEAELGPVLAGDAFVPPTEVESQAIKLWMRDAPLVEGIDPERLESVVRTAFGQRRKTLLNSLSRYAGLESKAELSNILLECGIDPQRRAETLSVEEFGELAKKIVAKVDHPE